MASGHAGDHRPHAGSLGGPLRKRWWEARGSAEATFALPGAWPEILGAQLVRPGLIFGALLILLLVVSEFSWRTARQNVIDGLSKPAWLRGKVYLLLLVGALFLAVQLATGLAFAAAGTEALGPAALLPGAHQLSAAGGILLAYLGYGGLALLVAVTVRSPGPAVGVWFLYVAAGERLLATLFGYVGPPVEAAARFLPVHLFNGLVVYEQHDPAAAAGGVAWEVLLPVAVGWIAVFVAASYVVHAHRDV